MRPFKLNPANDHWCSWTHTQDGLDRRGRKLRHCPHHAEELIRHKNGALFLRLGLPSTLIRHKNAALFLRLGLPSTLIRHKNVALFLRLGLPSTLIRHEDGAFRKRSSNWRNLKTSAFRFRADGEHFENGNFRKGGSHCNHYFPDRGFIKH